MIELRRSIYNYIVEEAKKGYPNETCGILAGIKNGPLENRIIIKACRIKNTLESKTKYAMDVKEQIQWTKRFREEGLLVLGYWHSHPASEAYPSKEDVRLAFDVSSSYLIVSLEKWDEPVVRSFRFVDGGIIEEALFIVEGA